jgi:hypothetical protein
MGTLYYGDNLDILRRYLKEGIRFRCNFSYESGRGYLFTGRFTVVTNA